MHFVSRTQRFVLELDWHLQNVLRVILSGVLRRDAERKIFVSVSVIHGLEWMDGWVYLSLRR